LRTFATECRVCTVRGGYHIKNRFTMSKLTYISKEGKEEIFSKFGKQKSSSDTGSAESQIALFTARIEHLTEHLRKHKHDYATRLGLLKLVGKRRSLLDYLKRTDIARYRAIIAELKIRK
jgi:small subunit ribosomal protein S15